MGRRIAVGLVAALVATGTAGAAVHRSRTVVVGLDSSTVVVDARGERRLVQGSADDPLIAWRAADPVAAAANQAWLAAGRVPGGATPWAPMIRTALLDLHTLTLPSGAAVAGWSTPWQYVWPRDAAFTAVAFAATGHPDDAAAVLTFLQQVQEPDGTFHARYLPDGSGPPDSRGIELDGSGWVLWATAEVAARLPAGGAPRVDTSGDDTPASRPRSVHSGAASSPERLALLQRLRPLIDRSAAAAVRLTGADRGLPPASLDFWETSESVVTLGTAAPLLAGLEAAVRLYTELGDAPAASRVSAAARALDTAIDERFAPDGFPRSLGGDQRDASITFLMPPFRAGGPAGPDQAVDLTVAQAVDRAVDQVVEQAWSRAQVELLRPAGGLAPGAGWKQDGISWTPETALFALTAAATGRRDTASHWLTWLAAHRTAAGSLPEKVLSDGSPAAVAPLAWTSAAVVLAATLLDDAG